LQVRQWRAWTCACGTVNKENLIALLKNNEKPEWWKGNHKICYRLFNKIIETTCSLEGNQEERVKRSLHVLDPNIIIPAHIKNLKRKVVNMLAKDPEGSCTVILQLYKEHEQASVGDECLRLGITDQVLHDILSSGKQQRVGKTPVVFLTNKLVIELNETRERMGKSWVDILTWLRVLSNNHSFETVDSVHVAIERAADHKRELVLHKKKELCEEYLAKEFLLPQKKSIESVPAQNDHAVQYQMFLDQQAREIEILLSQMEHSNKEVEMLSQLVKEQSEVDIAKANEVNRLRSNLHEMQSKHEETSKKLQDAIEKLSKVSARNVNKKLKRRDVTNEKLKEMTTLQQVEIDKKETDLQAQAKIHMDLIDRKDKTIQWLNKRLDSALEAKTKAQKLKSYYKSKAVCQKTEGPLFSKISELKSHIAELENEVEVLQEHIQDFLKTPMVKAFQNGKYTDEVRAVYEDLLCWGVGVENVQKVVRTVIENLAGLECERLPKATFARYMYLEARRLSQIQVAEQLLDEWDSGNRTLHSDGTSKHGYHYATFDVTLDDGNVMVAGLRDMACGDAESQLNLLKEVLGDITSSVEDENADKKVMKSIKNLMSDRCIVQKKFNEILQTYRQSILPEVVEEWDIMDDDEKSKVSRMNDLFCGLHYIVGLADQAEEALRVWDKLLYDETKVGSLSQGGYSKGGESGTLRLLRTVCKAVQAKGCERSGRAVSFADHARENGIESIPLAPFLGNRFNIIFHNGGGVFYLHEHLRSFFDMMKDENKLLKAVYYDLEVSSFLAGCRALGLINKFITGPLWRVLEKEDVSFMDMSARYQRLLECFEEWAQDSTPVLTGEAVVFDDVKLKKDLCYEKLIKEDPDWDPMTKQVLELIFGSFVVVTKRMLTDHLEGGKYDKPDVEMQDECKNAPKTNVVPERDFGMLDRLLAQKPNATTLVFEGILMSTKNDTKGWRDSLTPEKRKAVMEMVRNSKASQRQQFIERKAIIRKKREEKLEKGKQEKERKETKLRMLKQDLVQKVEELGGMWKTDTEVDEQIAKISKEKDKKIAIKTQIQFRKIVLGAKHKDKKVFQMSSEGNAFSSQVLVSNLKEIIRQSMEDSKKVTEPENPQVTRVGQKLISREKMLEQKELYKQRASKEVEKAGGKRKGDGPTTNDKRSAKRKKDGQQNENVPTIVVPVDLVGKRISHHCFENDEADWFEGVVIDISETNNQDPDLYIRYDGYDSLYIFSYHDFKDGNVKLIPVSEEDFLGKKISQRFEDEAQNHSWWENGRVLQIVEGSDDTNPEFVIEFDSQSELDGTEDEASTESEVCIFNLFEDYLNNDLRIL
jgi:hypothetical protein